MRGTTHRIRGGLIIIIIIIIVINYFIKFLKMKKYPAIVSDIDGVL
jgi:hypothetical protein